MASTNIDATSADNSPRVRHFGIVLTLSCAAPLLFGCDGSGKAPPPVPAGSVMPVAPPPAANGASPASGTNNEKAPPANRAQPATGSQAPKRPSAGGQSGLSGDTEPPGRDGEFLILDEGEQGGSVWALDLPDAENNVDRFAFVPASEKLDSTSFAIVDEGQETSKAPAKAGSLPDGFSAVSEAGYHADGLPLRVRCEKDGSIMALVPEGVFVQGKNGRAANAGPEHGVALDAYYIDIYEVTYEKFAAYREAVRGAKRPVSEPAFKPENRSEPVTGLGWAEARAYAQWTGRELPTEAEWEKAARGTQGFDFPWGNGAPVWQRPRAVGQIDEVGSFQGDVSPFGVYDLAGNVREWCNDLYHEKYYEQLVRDTGATAHNPTGPRSSGGANQRVVKGGDPQWFVWARAGGNMNDRLRDVGFRCAWKVKAPAKKR